MFDKAIALAKELVMYAIKNKKPLQIVGGNSKSFYGNKLCELPKLSTTNFDGIIQYDPGELVIQVGAGTNLVEVTKVLESEGQMLAFEPPSFDGNATIGGVIASGLSGSRRPYAGSARDFVLGVDIIDGKAQHLSFGGQVMKNVAGYDVSRLLTASMGCLGLITEVSLKVLPKPAAERTQRIEIDRFSAHKLMRELQFSSALLSASAYFNEQLYVRFSGMETSVIKASKAFGGEQVNGIIWSEIDNLQLFDIKDDLWRVSLLPGSKLFLKEAGLIDWGGGQRWIVDPKNPVRETFLDSGEAGHITLVRLGSKSCDQDRFQALSPYLLKIHQGLKAQFDPAGILNPYKIYKQF
jgi:glycolate oxidase FAD binding subunit